MPLRQIARTPSRPFPPRDGHGIPYAFAVEIRHSDLDGAEWPVIRCPWCGQEHMVVKLEPSCPLIGRRYTVAIPAGTPVLA